MNLNHFQSAPPSPWLPMLPPEPPHSIAFWQNRNASDRIHELQDTLNLAMAKELEMWMMIKEGKGSEDVRDGSTEPSVSACLKCVEDRRVGLETHESLAVEAANALISELRALLEPFRYIVDEASPWEEKSAVARIENKLHRSKRDKLRRKRKRKCIAENFAMEREQFDQIGREADEWTAWEIAKDIARRKMEKMKEIAKLKAKEEKKKLEAELELLLMVEKLQELPFIRIQKLKKHGHFLPEEDNKFLERVQAAVEEEERQALVAADTDAANDAIATAEESRKTIQNQGNPSKDPSNDNKEVEEHKEQDTRSDDKEGSSATAEKASTKILFEGQSYGRAYDSLANLPIEFYHYYHGSNNDMSTLIEVRRGWDAYISPGGSRIPGH